MWIGLFDKHRDPFHPHDLGRVDCEYVEMRLRYGKQDWLILTNESMLYFKVHRDLIHEPHFFSFFREEYDVMPCYALLALATSGNWQPIRAGNLLSLGPGTFKCALPGPAQPGVSGLYLDAPQRKLLR